MALKQKTTPTFENEPASTNGGEAPFEPINNADTAVAEKPADAAEKPAPQCAEPADEVKVAAAQTTATTAIAKASATSTAVADAAAKAKQFQREVNEMKDASDFSYGNYRVFKGNNGEISESGGEEDSLGRWAKVRLLSWGEHHEISPGETGASTKDFVAYSKDGKVVDSVIGEELKIWVGRTVADYVEYLRNTEEFSKTKCRRFIDTACALLATDSGEGPIGKVIQVTLSESSIPAFSRYQQELADSARCAAMGLPGFSIPEDAHTFYFIREIAKKGDNSWTKLRISQDLPVKI